MNNQGFTVVDKAVVSAQQLGALQGQAIWALFCLLLVAFVVYMLRQAKSSSEEWQKIRIQEAQSDLTMAQAVQKMADEIMTLRTIVSERLPGRIP